MMCRFLLISVSLGACVVASSPSVGRKPLARTASYKVDYRGQTSGLRKKSVATETADEGSLTHSSSRGVRADAAEIRLQVRGRATILGTGPELKLQKASELENPWAEAMSCVEGNKNDCSCGGWGRWMPADVAPPACMRNTLASVYALTQFVESKGYEALLGGGSLLGATRCGSFIPWDYDADLSIAVDTDEQKEQLQREINAWQGGSQKPESVWVTVFGDLGDWNPKRPGQSKETTLGGNVHLDVSILAGKTRPNSVPCVLNDVIVRCPETKVVDDSLTEKYGTSWCTTPKRWANWEQHKLNDAPVQLDVNRTGNSGCAERRQSIMQLLEGRPPLAASCQE